MISKLAVNIKRRNTKLTQSMYNLAKKVQHFNVPSIKIIHLPLYYLIKFTINTLLLLKHKFYDEPVFKAHCVKVGKNLRLPDGMPLIIGNLKLYIGDNVTIYRTTLGAAYIIESPTLKIGDNTTIGYGTTISVAEKVKIGNHVMVAANCYIADNDEHPVNPSKRKLYQPVEIKDVSPVVLEDNSWVGYNSVILKGVTLGENSMLGAHSTAMRSIPKNSIALGYPARVVMSDIHLSE